MELDNKYKIVGKWLQEKEKTGKSRLEMLLYNLNDEVEAQEDIKIFQEMGDSTITNRKVADILNIFFNKAHVPLKAKHKGTEKIRIRRVDKPPKKKPIKIYKLVDAGLLEDGQKLYVYDPQTRKIYKNEYAVVEYKFNLSNSYGTQNPMRLYGDTKGEGSPSDLASKLRHKYGITKWEREAQGPIYWITEDGETLDNLNNKARRMGL